MDNLTPITREEMLMNDEPLTPITREEKILAGEDLTPVTRREYFLKKYRHAGGEVMVEGLSVTENGTYTAPEGKAYSPVEVAVPLPPNAYLLKEASGSLVSFSDGADLPMPSFICNISAQQDLHGYDSPWVGGAGKNKLPMTVDGIKAVNTSGTWSGNSFTTSGVTFSILIDSDGNVVGIATSGTSSNYIYFILGYVDAEIGMIINGAPTGGDRYKWFQAIDTTSDFDYGNGATISTSVTNKKFMIVVANGVDMGNKIFYPMIRLATETDPTFAPYSNICPISGHTGVDAWVRGKNLFDKNANDVAVGYYLNASTGVISPSQSGYNTSGYIPIEPNTYYTKSGASVSADEYCFYDFEKAFISGLSRTDTTVLSPNNAAYMRFDYKASETDNIQIELGETATEYEPYNPQSQTISVSWQTEAGEVFGGYVDLVSGVLTVTDGYIASYNGETLPSTWISDRDTYAEGTSPTTGAEVVYKLANAQTYQLDGNQIKSLLGNNNAWCSTGDVDIDYFAKEV